MESLFLILSHHYVLMT